MSSASSYCLLSTRVGGKDISKTELFALVRSSVPWTRAPTPAALSPVASIGLQPVLCLEGKTNFRQLFGIRWSLRPLPTQTLLFCGIVPGCWLGSKQGPGLRGVKIAIQGLIFLISGSDSWFASSVRIN